MKEKMGRSIGTLLALALVGCGTSSSGGGAGSGGFASTGGAPGTAGSSAPSGGSGASSATRGGAPASGGSSSEGTLPTGAPCTDDSQCGALGLQTGTCMKDWPGGGACTIVGCSPGECPGDPNEVWCTLDKTGEESYCAIGCEPGIIPCTQPGYVCAPSGGCLPPDVGGVVGGDP